MEKRLRGKIACVAAAAFALAAFTPLSCGENRHFELSRFISPDVCGGCHGGIYAQWKNSMHNLAHHDPLYREAARYYLEGLTDSDEIQEAESCVKCHTPVGYFSGKPRKTSEEEREAPAIAREGIQCDFCHSATGAYRVYNNHIKLDPGHGEEKPGVKRGPFDDSVCDYHGCEYSEFHTGSEVCGVCHDVRHVVFGTKLETTYEEWKAGPYNSSDPAKRVPCQGCHMYQRPGVPATGSTERPANPGAAADGGKVRPHIFTHYFAGGNTLVPGLYKDSEKPKMAEERLRNAARLEIDGSDIQKGLVRVTVRNTGAGHKLPTGLTDVRQMWLQVTVALDSGKVLYVTGTPDRLGYLGKDTIIYNTVFGDGKGNPVENIAKAREVLKDRRVPPGGFLTETYDVKGAVPGRTTVTVKLLYRLLPQETVDKLVGKGKIKLPIVTMAEAKKRV